MSPRPGREHHDATDDIRYPDFSGMSDFNLKLDESYATNLDEYDDDFDRETYSSGRTLASTVTRYLYENGRRYHAYREGQYYQPNDEQVNSHEIIAHHLYLLTLDDKLFLAPIEDPQRILDLGTGTGLWAEDIADFFPSAEVYAMDLSPAPPNIHPNLHFEVDDFLSPWTHPQNSFDFVHMRYLMGCIPDQLALYQEAIKHIKPGGYIEHIEFEMRIVSPPPSNPEADAIYNRLTESILEAGRRMGKGFDIVLHMERLMEEAGFTEIVEKVVPWPLGAWPSDPKLKDIGRWNVRNWEEGIEGWVLALFTRILGWSFEEVQDFLREVKKKAKDKTLHYYYEVRICYGRKPLDGPTFGDNNLPPDFTQQ